jgi:hypothetical protein
MRCPKCQFDHELQTTECLKCGIVFARYEEALKAKKADVAAPGVPVPVPAAMAVPSALAPSAPLTEPYDARRELQYRALALPLALLVGRWVAGSSLGWVAGLLAMIVHESGHAVTAWLTGRWAVPSFGVTMTGDYRSWWIVLGLAGALVFAGYKAWKAQSWGWVCAAGAVLLLQLVIQGQPAFTQGSLIVFGGDGGALVLATVVMSTFYVSRQSLLFKAQGVRWGLLVLGALSFTYVYRLWSGPWENIPFGEVEGVNLSDPTRLTDEYGWSVIQMVDRYLLLARVCFAALIVLYVWGLVSTYLDMRSEKISR